MSNNVFADPFTAKQWAQEHAATLESWADNTTDAAKAAFWRERAEFWRNWNGERKAA